MASLSIKEITTQLWNKSKSTFATKDQVTTAVSNIEVGVIYDENTHSLTFGNVNENLLLLSETLSQVVEVE